MFNDLAFGVQQPNNRANTLNNTMDLKNRIITSQATPITTTVPQKGAAPMTDIRAKR